MKTFSHMKPDVTNGYKGIEHWREWQNVLLRWVKGYNYNFNINPIFRTDVKTLNVLTETKASLSNIKLIGKYLQHLRIDKS